MHEASEQLTESSRRISDLESALVAVTLRLEKAEEAVLSLEGKLASIGSVLERLDEKVRKAGL